jgi:hypothetical protein
MTTQTAETQSFRDGPLVGRLNYILELGRGHLENPRLDNVSIRKWLALARRELTVIYGREHELVALWTKTIRLIAFEQSSLVDRSRALFVKFFLHFERLTDALSNSGKASFASADKSIFIGHGRSLIWHQLNTFLTRRGLTCVEFEPENMAGRKTTARIDEMLDTAEFAFLIMTAEDEHIDGTFRARQNVIHEIGLFQGRLGEGKVITLREDGCESYSNAAGVNDIRFPRGNLEPTFHRISLALERESLL